MANHNDVQFLFTPPLSPFICSTVTEGEYLHKLQNSTPRLAYKSHAVEVYTSIFALISNLTQTMEVSQYLNNVSFQPMSRQSFSTRVMGPWILQVVGRWPKCQTKMRTLLLIFHLLTSLITELRFIFSPPDRITATNLASTNYLCRHELYSWYAESNIHEL